MTGETVLKRLQRCQCGHGKFQHYRSTRHCNGAGPCACRQFVAPASDDLAMCGSCGAAPTETEAAPDALRELLDQLNQELSGYRHLRTCAWHDGLECDCSILQMRANIARYLASPPALSHAGVGLRWEGERYLLGGMHVGYIQCNRAQWTGYVNAAAIALRGDGSDLSDYCGSEAEARAAVESRSRELLGSPVPAVESVDWQSLTARVVGGRLVVSVGVALLAQAATNSPDFGGQIDDPIAFAKAVADKLNDQDMQVNNGLPRMGALLDQVTFDLAEEGHESIRFEDADV